jgi:hypothetical protein
VLYCKIFKEHESKDNLVDRFMLKRFQQRSNQVIRDKEMGENLIDLRYTRNNRKFNAKPDVKSLFEQNRNTILK